MVDIRLPQQQRFSDRELAHLFGVHLGTIYRWRYRGVRGHKLDGYWWGGRWHSDREHVVAFLGAINQRPIRARPATGPDDHVERELDRLGLGDHRPAGRKGGRKPRVQEG